VSAETNLLAAITRQAILDALTGDQEADEWLEHHSLPVLEHLAPEYMTGRELQKLLFKHLGDKKKATRLYRYLRTPERERAVPDRRLCPQCGLELEAGVALCAPDSILTLIINTIYSTKT
jgi:hypothetical protein